MYVLNLYFNPKPDKDSVFDVVKALSYAYPGLTWMSGDMIDTTRSRNLMIISLHLIVKLDNNDNSYTLSRSGRRLEDGQYGVPPATDGWEWVNMQLALEKNESEGFKTTSGFFDELNEIDVNRLIKKILNRLDS